ncbi:MAG: class III poly(R)-hydroxyalkanoic acid synthase subunit PhaC, partial [Desulfobulbaceae bacterium]|nr:class III poly(R)-hydroxyalkanoic acid synthase subunit PhaC [Desulfobulbaceae bacterium]
MAQPKVPVDLILRNLAEEVGSGQKRVSKAADVLLGDLKTDIATTPYEVVYQQDRVKLKHYTPTKKKKVQ